MSNENEGIKDSLQENSEKLLDSARGMKSE